MVVEIDVEKATQLHHIIYKDHSLEVSSHLLRIQQKQTHSLKIVKTMSANETVSKLLYNDLAQYLWGVTTQKES